MNAPTDKGVERLAALQGMGESRLRKEDARFIQGKGNYVDDIQLPGQLHMDIVRSPLAHARIKSIDKSAALAMPLAFAQEKTEDAAAQAQTQQGETTAEQATGSTTQSPTQSTQSALHCSALARSTTASRASTE